MFRRLAPASLLVFCSLLFAQDPYKSFSGLTPIGMAIDDNRLAWSQGTVVSTYEFDGTAWVGTGGISSPAQSGNVGKFGERLEIQGDRLVISDFRESVYKDGLGGGWKNGAGAVYVYDWDGTQWVKTVDLNRTRISELSYFGYEITLDGDVLAVSATGSSSSGVHEVSIFRYDGTNWNREITIAGSDYRYANSIDLSGNTILIGDSPVNSFQGAVESYVYDGTSWESVTGPSPATPITGDGFGYKVLIDGNLAVINAFWHDADAGHTNSGGLYTFEHDGSTWVEKSILYAPDFSRIGLAVEIVDSSLVIGYDARAENGDLTGAAALYEWDGTNWISPVILWPAFPQNLGRFGTFVDLSEMRVAVSTGAIGANEVSIFHRDVRSISTPETVQIFLDSPVGKSDTLSVEVQNTGFSAIAITAQAVSGAPFEVVTPLPSSIVPGETGGAAIAFHATTPGLFEGTYIITSDSPTSPDTVWLSGTSMDTVGVATFDIVGGLSFPNTDLNQASVMPLKITNSGLGILTGTAMSNSPDYSIEPEAYSLVVGDSIEFAVTFMPIGGGIRTADIIFTHNGTFSPDSIATTGTGLLPGMKLKAFASFTVLPSFVNALFQITDLNGWGIRVLDKVEEYQFLEDGSPISTTESIPRIGRIDAVPYTMKTVLILDNSFSIGLALDSLKSAAKEVVNGKFPEQEVAILTFSETIVLRQDFSTDASALMLAIDNITLGPASTNLYGAVVDGAGRWTDHADADSIINGNMIIFTDGQDTQGSTSLSAAIAATSGREVVTVGVGSSVDAAVLQQIQTAGYYAASSYSELAEIFSEIQRKNESLAKSFYWLSYISPTRGANNHTLSVSVNDNPHTGSDATLSFGFTSDGFSSVNPGVFVNRSYQQLSGIDTIYFGVESSLNLVAETLFELQSPGYKWEVSDPTALTLVVTGEINEMALITQVGAIQTGAAVTLRDTANSYVKTIIIDSDLQPPAVPLGLAASAGESQVTLSWTATTDQSVVGYVIYGGTDATPITPVDTVLSPSQTSAVIGGLTADIAYNFRMTAITAAGLQSGYSAIVTATPFTTVGTETVATIPTKYELHQNFPNPFNPTSTIRFDLPEATNLELVIYDLRGRTIA
ncbi:MAG: VWA domain-containing protein, partial [Candidatus Marinimicrobia bacterium]|nr:VWA domain-containing protein [Candidatus Neomarinimicrobiota bacterium]